MRAKEETRRGFLGKATVAGAALAAAGAMSTARADDEDEQRRAIPARPGAPFSRAVSFDGVVFVAGVVGRAPGEFDDRRHGAVIRDRREQAVARIDLCPAVPRLRGVHRAGRRSRALHLRQQRQ